jgi:polysaccharide export outer membrane protein
VRVIFDNFKITVLGEVQKPGVYSVRNERLTLPEALGLAGDMTIYGNRKNVLLIREENKKRNFIRIDLTNRDFFDSPHYFLNPNDIIYVEPTKGKTAISDNFYRIAPIVISTLTLISLLLVRFNNN